MIISIQNTIDNANSIFILAKIKDSYLTFDIDTGATHSVIFDYVYDQFKQGFESTDQSLNMFGIDGQYKTNPIVKSNLIFGNNSYETEFQVVSADNVVNNVQKEFGIQLHGILGIQFLKNANCVIDFANKTIKIGE